MATLPTITGSFVKSYDREYPYTGSTEVQHFGYSRYGHRAVSIFKFTMPSYSGTPDSLAITLKVVRGAAYPTNKTSRWNVTLDPNDAGYSSTSGSCSNPLANGLYTNHYNDYTLTFPSKETETATVTATESSFTVTYTSLSNSMYESGEDFYAYLYSDTGNHDMIKCNTITATLTYTPEDTTTTTDTELRVGKSTSSTAPSSWSKNSVNLTYKYNYLHYKISGLQNAANIYDGFYIYDWSNISSYFTQGMTWSKMTNNENYLGKTTSTSTEKTVSGYIITPKMDSELRVAKTRNIVCLAVSSGRAWQIGGDTTNSIPQKCEVSLTPDNFIKSNITITRTASTATTATYSITVNKNTNGYINNVTYNLSYLRSESGSNTAPTVKGGVTFSSKSYPQTKTLTVTGLTAGASNTIYFNVHCNQDFSAYKYYGHSSDSFITDLADSDPTSSTDSGYTGSASYTLTAPQTATLNVSVNTTHNLSTYIYYTTSSTAPTSVPSTKIDIGGGTSGSVTNVSVTSSKTFYFWVRSTVSKIYYKIASVTVIPDASSYKATISTSNIGVTTANFSHATLPSTTNLGTQWYVRTYDYGNTSPSIDSSGNSYNVGYGNRGSTINGSNLVEATTQTVYAYVYSTASKYYHKVGSVSVTTNSSGYTGKVAVTGITGTSATLCLFAVSPTANMDSGYYATTTNYGSTTTTTPGTRIAIKNSTVITGLVPGKQYTYYFYMKNTSNNTFYLVSTQTFETYSSLVTYQGQPHRVWYYNTTNSRWEAAILKQGGSNVTITNLLPELGFKNVNNTATNVTWNTTYKHFGEGSICLKPTSAAVEFTWPVSYKSGLGHNGNPYQTKNHIYYLSMWVYQPTKVGSVDFYWPIAEPVFMAGKTTSASGKWTKISSRNTRSNWSTGNQACRIDFNNPDGTNAMYYADIMLVDLTATFGSGKEPSQDWCDKNIPYIPVKGTVFISSEESKW